MGLAAWRRRAPTSSRTAPHGSSSALAECQSYRLKNRGGLLRRREPALLMRARRTSYESLARTRALLRRVGVGMPGSDELTVDGVAKLTVPLLKAALTERGLSSTGLKAELAKRLVEALQAPQTVGAAAEPAPVPEAAAAPAAPAAPAEPAAPSVQPVVAPEATPAVEPTPAPTSAPPAQSPVR